MANAKRDLSIAARDDILDVKFTYAYSALLKAGITLLSKRGVRAKSVPGHHVAIIDALSGLLKDKAISTMGNLMRAKRNLDLYAGGVEVTETECREYIGFVKSVVERVEETIAAGSQ